MSVDVEMADVEATAPDTEAPVCIKLLVIYLCLYLVPVIISVSLLPPLPGIATTRKETKKPQLQTCIAIWTCLPFKRANRPKDVTTEYQYLALILVFTPL